MVENGIVSIGRVENDNDSAAPGQLVLDPTTVVKTIAAGICAAAIALLEKRTGTSSTTKRAARTGDIMTADEVAELLRLDRKTVYDYAGRGEIPCQRLGKRILFSRDALALWLRSCSKGSSEGS
jgi:excisionase family DNA binding protein